jgi:G3E family GTPase
MASPRQITKLLKDHEQQLGIEVRPLIVMLSAEGFDAQTYEQMPYYRAFTDVADIMVFNRCDKANDVKKQACQDWARQLNPAPKHVLLTSHGQLPDKLFDIPNTPAPEPNTDHAANQQHHHHDDGPKMSAGGWISSAAEVFEKDRLLINMMRICYQGIDGITISRLKGIFKTDAGWLSIHIANGEVSVLPSSWREDNRMDWITLNGELTENVLIDELCKPLAWRENSSMIQHKESN